MTPPLLDRRSFSTRLGALAAAASFGRVGAFGRLHQNDEISHSAESIHQDVVISAAPSRVYEALLDAKQFTAMTAFSTVPKSPPAEITHEAGKVFSLFGGHIQGRNVELVRNERIVQAWRADDWPAGVYSIVRFQFVGDGGKTTIHFDHTGFPAGKAEGLASGWRANYWTPLAKYLV
jgi:activator of HSP90 ATPase